MRIKTISYKRTPFNQSNRREMPSGKQVNRKVENKKKEKSETLKQNVDEEYINRITKEIQ